MGTNSAPLLADLFLDAYETRVFQVNIIENYPKPLIPDSPIDLDLFLSNSPFNDYL